MKTKTAVEVLKEELDLHWSLPDEHTTEGYRKVRDALQLAIKVMERLSEDKIVEIIAKVAYQGLDAEQYGLNVKEIAISIVSGLTKENI